MEIVKERQAQEEAAKQQTAELLANLQTAAGGVKDLATAQSMAPAGAPAQ